MNPYSSNYHFAGAVATFLISLMCFFVGLGVPFSRNAVVIEDRLIAIILCLIFGYLFIKFRKNYLQISEDEDNPTLR